jgi:hypothetical protein
MITAQEAKALYDQSGAEVDAFLKYHADEQIKFAAKDGKRTIFIHCGSKECYLTECKPNPVEKGAIAKLTELGYVAQWIPRHGESYVPRGLADDAGEGPSYRNYGIQINW